MLPKRLLEGLDEVRLRNFLVLFFLALAAPTAILIWQAYSQLKWEAFHQYQGDAEEFSRRVDARLDELVRTADARTFADYTFLIVSGDPSANFVQRSPLSAYPVIEDVPGVLGYFQVDSDGEFSTPLLPPEGAEATSLGIGESEYNERLNLAVQLQAVLADNRLVQSHAAIGSRRPLALPAETPSAVSEEAKEEDLVDGLEGSAFADEDVADRPEYRAAEPQALPDDSYSQQVFDQLNEPRQNAGLKSAVDSKRDAALQKKQAMAEAESPRAMGRADSIESIQSRRKRTEQSALPEPAVAPEADEIANVSGLTDLRISTFESEIDPLEFSLLDSGHFVLFRKVWRDGERYIQGLLLDQRRFTEDIVAASFMATALADMTSLSVAYQDSVIHTVDGRDENKPTYPNVTEDLDGSLLYRNRLSAPLNSLELIFSIRRLPPGPGASVLGWVTLVLAIVLVGGFVTLYRTGLRQIALARQQQDFVSAVSHELKSPLTSIRMYGEMLKEGWADEEKRQGYYEYIHDESERLSKLIGNVLQLSRITRNEPMFDPKPTKVAELMSNTVSKISSQIERAGFELRIATNEEVSQTYIDIDQDCFAQMIINLVDNAIKFSRDAEKKIVEITCKQSGDKQIVFSVRDYGPGIPKDQMKKIFQLFYRSESELTRETVGTGIGLAIVHQLAIAMGGSVDLINAEPGAEFRLRFSSCETR